MQNPNLKTRSKREIETNLLSAHDLMACSLRIVGPFLSAKAFVSNGVVGGVVANLLLSAATDARVNSVSKDKHAL